MQVGTIVYHVASHEIGHAIYGLDAVAQHIKVSTKTLLEEPRAELTALHTLPLLLAAGILDQVPALTLGCGTALHPASPSPPPLSQHGASFPCKCWLQLWLGEDVVRSSSPPAPDSRRVACIQHI